MGEYADLQIEEDMKEIAEKFMREQDCLIDGPTTHHNRKPHMKLITCGLCGKKVKMNGVSAHRNNHLEEDKKERAPLVDYAREEFEQWVLANPKKHLYPLYRSFYSKGMYYNNRTQQTYEGFIAAYEVFRVQ